MNASEVRHWTGLPTDIVVYLGMDRKEYHDNIDSLAGMTVPSGGYWCCSLRNQGAARYARKAKNPVMMEIKVPKGTHAAYLPSVTNRQVLDDELVIDRRHKMKVVSVTNQPGKPLLMKVAVVLE